MYLSGLEMTVAIPNKKLFKIWPRNIWHLRHQNEKEMAQTIFMLSVRVRESVLSHLKVHQSLLFIKAKNQSHSLDFSLVGMMNFGILMYQINCSIHKKMLNKMRISSNLSVDVKIVQIKSLLESSFSHFFALFEFALS